MSAHTAPVRQFYEAKIAAHEEDFEAFADDQDLSRLRDPAGHPDVPTSVIEACGFYYETVLEQDWGDVQAFRVPFGGEITYAIRVTSDGGDGWLEIFDGRGELLGAARTDCGIVLWRPREEIRLRVTEGLPLEPEFVAERERRQQPH